MESNATQPRKSSKGPASLTSPRLSSKETEGTQGTPSGRGVASKESVGSSGTTPQSSCQANDGGAGGAAATEGGAEAGVAGGGSDGGNKRDMPTAAVGAAGPGATAAVTPQTNRQQSGGSSNGDDCVFSSGSLPSDYPRKGSSRRPLSTVESFWRRFRWIPSGTGPPLAFAGLVSGLLGMAAYDLTGCNAVWGIGVETLEPAIAKQLSSAECMLLFACKLVAAAVQIGCGGPGGLFLPSMMAGGFHGLAVARLFSKDPKLLSAAAAVGAGAVISSTMHLPLTSFVVIMEVMGADTWLLQQTIVANFLAFTVCAHLPNPYTFNEHIEREERHPRLYGFLESDEQELWRLVEGRRSTEEAQKLRKEVISGLSLIEEKDGVLVRIVETCSLRVTLPDTGEILVSRFTMEKTADGKLKKRKRDALPGIKKGVHEKPREALRQLLETDLAAINPYLREPKIKSNLEHNVVVKDSPSFPCILSIYRDTIIPMDFIESSVDEEVLRQFGLLERTEFGGLPKGEHGESFNLPKGTKGDIAYYEWCTPAQIENESIVVGGGR